MFCPKCGYRNPDNAKFCMKCGIEIPANSLEGETLEIPKEYQDPVEKKKANIKGVLALVAIFGFIPAVILFEVFLPVVVGFIWMAIMVVIAWKVKLKNNKFILLVFGVLAFFALMGTVTDMYGNPGTHYVLKKLYFEENEKLTIEKYVYHSEPGETSMNYYKYRITPNGEKILITNEKALLANAIFYFGIAVILTILNFIINLFRLENAVIGPPEI